AIETSEREATSSGRDAKDMRCDVALMAKEETSIEEVRKQDKQVLGENASDAEPEGRDVEVWVAMQQTSPELLAEKEKEQQKTGLLVSRAEAAGGRATGVEPVPVDATVEFTRERDVAKQAALNCSWPRVSWPVQRQAS
ncbi:unnamed protein product, partial [Prorocentrum cordatum]